MIAEALNGWLRKAPAWPIYIVGPLPAVFLVWQGVAGTLGPDPVRAIEQQTGLYALQLIIAGLAVTPLRRFAGVNLLKFRRAIGIMAFSYVAVHLLTWLVLDMGLYLTQAVGDVVKRPYITLGMSAFLMLVPLVATSNDRALRRLGAARWRKLHRLTYPAAVLAAVHFVWLVKAWPLQPFLYLGAVAGLLALRAKPKRRAPAAAQGAVSP
ncbi:MAG TPA: protein-methionine-sulfoxide reductase heme-binding subunit MsrQ [Albidovulum sp.]|uniref:protein-methionine-sulfoxide reductase heme-binding subunit MsrQ n=1 Tax=Albidovulum sp. TaxID=1872424 RepID=UPI002C40C202|nr:protein-methionine-sulfoxide reductase heme-binding subunit MsrQ [Albidovulum sp.]